MVETSLGGAQRPRGRMVFGRLRPRLPIHGSPGGIQIVAATNVTVSGNVVVGANALYGVEGSRHTVVSNVIRNSAIGFSVIGMQSVIAGNVLRLKSRSAAN